MKYGHEQAEISIDIYYYDVSDGLAHSHVTAMHQDARGFLWLATWEGLSRFDGYRFISYSERDGLGDPIINAVAEDRNGHLWVGTNRVEALEATNAALKQLQEALACAQRKEDSASAEVRPSSVGPSAAKQHPNIYRAVDALGAAEGELQNASHDFCGHRVEALDATRTALNQLKRAIQCAEK